MSTPIGGYVFISHSHKDIEKVRQIRNEMEAAGFEPLCFFLKCLSDEDEIEDLIKREIDAREWFVFIESPNSLSSSWVRKEREYISSRGGKQVVKVDLSKETSMHGVAQRLIRMLRVYIAFSQEDSEFASVLRDRLVEKDYQVLPGPYQISPDYSRDMFLNEKRDDILKAGCMVAVISENSVKDYCFREELYHAYQNNIPIIPVYLDGFSPEGLELTAGGGQIPLDIFQESASSRSKPEDWELSRIVIALEMTVNFDIRAALAKAKSHNEIFQYEWRFHGDPEVMRLCQEAHDRLDADPDY